MTLAGVGGAGQGSGAGSVTTTAAQNAALSSQKQLNLNGVSISSSTFKSTKTPKQAYGTLFGKSFGLPGGRTAAKEAFASSHGSHSFGDNDGGNQVKHFQTLSRGRDEQGHSQTRIIALDEDEEAFGIRTHRSRRVVHDNLLENIKEHEDEIIDLNIGSSGKSQQELAEYSEKMYTGGVLGKKSHKQGLANEKPPGGKHQSTVKKENR